MSMIDTAATLINSNPVTRWMVQTVRKWLGKRYGGYILAYHEISGQRFIEQVEALLPDKPISLSELLEMKRDGRSTAGRFAITFDDGYANTVPAIANIAIERNWPVTFYLPTKFIDGGYMPYLLLRNMEALMPGQVVEVKGKPIDFADPKVRFHFFNDLRERMYAEHEDNYWPDFIALAKLMMDQLLVTEQELYDMPKAIDRQQVSALSKHPLIDMQSHGITHMAVKVLNEHDLVHELTQSKEIIRSITGRPVEHFCYPYGWNESIDERAIAITARHYQSAVTMYRGRVNGARDHFLPRIDLYEKDTPALVRIKTITR